MFTESEDLTLHETLTARGYTTRGASNYRKEIVNPDGTVAFTGTANDVWIWLKTPDAAPFICLKCGTAPRTGGDFGQFCTDCPNCEDGELQPNGGGRTEAESVADWNEVTLDQLEIRKAATA